MPGGPRYVAGRTANKVKRLSLVALPEYHTHFSGEGCLLLCALVRRLRGRISGKHSCISVEVEHRAVGKPALLVPLHALHSNHHPCPAGAAGHRGSNPTRLGLRSSGALSHLFPSAFTCVAALSLLLLRKFDPRLLLAIGLACTAFAAWLNSQYSSTWAAENFYRTSCSPASGQAFAFIGFVAASCCKQSFAGALAKPEWVLTLFAFFHTIRIFGGTAGANLHGSFCGATRNSCTRTSGTSCQQRRLDHRSERFTP